MSSNSTKPSPCIFTIADDSSRTYHGLRTGRKWNGHDVVLVDRDLWATLHDVIAEESGVAWTEADRRAARRYLPGGEVAFELEGFTTRAYPVPADASKLSLEQAACVYTALRCLEAGCHPLDLTEEQCELLESCGWDDGMEPYSMDFLQACADVPQVVALAGDMLPSHLDAPEACWACEGSGIDTRFERNPCVHCDGDGYIL